MLTKNIILKNVHRLGRPGLGHVYKGTVTIGELHHALLDSDIGYSLKYQRGAKKGVNVDNVDPGMLLNILDDRLNISHERAEQIAVKYLMARNGEHGGIALFNPDIIWNARDEENRPKPTYDEKAYELQIASRISIPDSAHRHYAYYLLGLWKKDPTKIPADVVIEEESEQSVSRQEIEKWLAGFNPFDANESSVFVEIFNLTTEAEGKLFVEYNELGKKPSNAASIDMYEDRTPSTRFVKQLMASSPIFARSEIETRSNTIGSKSRKLTTNATLVSAIKPYAKRIHDFEEQQPAVYQDLIEFFGEFFDEWSHHYPEYKPTASGDERNRLRERSFALSNIMFFPMFRLCFEFWDKYRQEGKDWHSAKEWRDALARLAGTTKVEMPGKKVKEVPIMARDFGRDSDESSVVGNPDWQGKILVRTFDKEGKPQGWSLSSTRQSRDAAFHYLVEKSGVRFPSRGAKRAA